jgi:lysozyme
MTVLGIDISKWDGDWDANKAKQAGATFVFIKASQAMLTDPKFLANWQKAKEAGLLRGAYHYLDYSTPGMDQANYFTELLKDDPGELPPVIDYELRRSDNNPSAALAFLRDCLDQLIKRSELFEDSTFKRPMIYTGPRFWTEYGDQTKSDYWIQFPLWNAHWITSSAPVIPLPWTMWHFWQFSSKGPGEAFGSESLTMNMNRFNGTFNELMEFAGIRIPVVNVCELIGTLEEKVDSLENTISSINKTGYANISSISNRVDNLEGKITNSCVSMTNLTTTLSQRLEAVEQKITNLGNSPTDLLGPITPGLDPPIKDNLPSESPVQDNPVLDPIITDDSPSDPLVQNISSSDPPVAPDALTSNNPYATVLRVLLMCAVVPVFHIQW